MKFAEFLRIPVLKNIHKQLLLYFENGYISMKLLFQKIVINNWYQQLAERKVPQYQFFPVASTNVGISLQILRSYLKRELEPRPPLQKLRFFFVKSIETRGYDNFFNRNARVTKLWPMAHDP